MPSDLGVLLRRRDALFDERVPLVAMRTLPEELRAAVAAADADVRIEIENRVAREVDVARDKRWRQAQFRERLPDRLVQRGRGGVGEERHEQQLGRLRRGAF